MALTVPSGQLPALVALRDLSDEGFDRLRDALQPLPALTAVTGLTHKAHAALPDLQADDVDRLLFSVIALAGLAAHNSWDGDLLVEQLVGSPQLRDWTSEERRVLGERVRAMLAVEAVSGSAKGTELLDNHPAVLRDVRIITDVRPIFPPDDLGTVAGAGITHTLRIDYRSGTRQRQFFVALDDDDLNELANV